MNLGTVETAPQCAPTQRPLFWNPGPATSTATATVVWKASTDLRVSEPAPVKQVSDARTGATAIDHGQGLLKDIIKVLSEFPEGYDVVSMKTVLIAAALLDQTRAFWQSSWVNPYITRSPAGEIVLEWWSGVRKLTVYVSEKSRDYVQVWGADMDSEMADGEITGGGELAKLLTWLGNKPA